jgi:hypothetical protein
MSTRGRDRDGALIVVIAVVAPQLGVALEGGRQVDRIVGVGVAHDPCGFLERLEDLRARDNVNPLENDLDEILNPGRRQSRLLGDHLGVRPDLVRGQRPG